ncbi:hypothetical protein P5673_028114 [Acropora cervicornis]|uniref:Uncharacterized protein n=1 Tax=Acropora cervicornis TaxID=6130 RepID=A0AAD9UV27_ACRCE|nr:hypothetical protein P5673_028114 [Acropora cervicornis]
MANLKRPELKLVAKYRNLAKDPVTERVDHYKSPLLEISALRSSLLDEASSVLRYTIDPQITPDDKKPWIWMDKLRAHYTDTSGSSILTDRFRLWTSSQASHESIQEWEVKVRQASSLCAYGDLTDELTGDKFIFGLNEDHTRTELLKTHVKPDNSKKPLQDVVAEARANQTNKLIVDSSKGTDEEVHWTGSLEAQVHSVASSSQAKRYFTTPALSTTGLAFTQVMFQIDTAATCNTMYLSKLQSFLPDADLKRSPYRLYPYRNSKPLEPEGQDDLVCERQDRYVTLTFQILPDSPIGSKPALLSGSDSERLGLVTIHADEIHSLYSEV